MKKRIGLGLAAMVALLFLASCQQINYEAYVTIVNIGNMPMTAWVDGDSEDIPAYDSQTWAVALETKDEAVQLHLEAKPQGDDKYDEIVVVLHGDRDIVTWLAGWDLVGESNCIKKKSSLIEGQASQELLKR